MVSPYYPVLYQSQGLENTSSCLSPQADNSYTNEPDKAVQ